MAVRSTRRVRPVTRPSRWRRALSWGLAIAALSFVAWVVPVRDVCWDERSPASTRVAVSYRGSVCTLHLRSGEVDLDAAACGRLKCEPGLASTLGRTHLGTLGALFVLYLLGTLAWAARWRALLAFADVHLRLGQAWRISTEAQAGGILLPGGLGGDALRVGSVVALLNPVRVAGERSRIAIVIASVVLDRAIGLAVIGALAAALGFALGGPEAGPATVALAALPIGLLGAFIVLRTAPLHRVRWLVGGRIGHVARPLLQYVRDPRAPGAIGVAAALSVLVASVQFATIRGLVAALGATPATEKWVYVGSAMAFLVSAVPALPGGWGTAEAAYVFFLGLAGLHSSIALAVCLLYRLFWYLLAVVGAMLHVARRRAFEALAKTAPPPGPRA